MRGTPWMYGCVITAAVLVGGCERMKLGSSSTKPVPPAVATPTRSERPVATSPAPPAERAPGEVMAHVNGQPIYMASLYEMLLEEHGVKLAQQLIADELVRQAGAEKNLTVTEAEIQAEHDQTLRNMFPQIDDPAQLERLLDQLLVRRELSRDLWRRTMRRNVLLGKLAAPQVQITEPELQEEFGAQYGRKVVVRHIQTAGLAEAQDVLKRLRAGEDFAKLAAEVSTNPSAAQGGLLPPIGAKVEGLPPAIRQAALAMNTPGELSEPIQVQTTFHVLRLEEVLPPQGVNFQDVRGRLEADLRAKKLMALRNRVLADLARSANVEYRDPILKRRAEEADGGALP